MHMYAVASELSVTAGQDEGRDAGSLETASVLASYPSLAIDVRMHVCILLLYSGDYL